MTVSVRPVGDGVCDRCGRSAALFTWCCEVDSDLAPRLSVPAMCAGCCQFQLEV